jgi:hypothetical protein
MAGLEILPKNWRDKVVVCPDPIAEQFKRWGKERIWVDDNCPSQLSIVIVDEELNVFRLTDPAYTLLILRALKWPDFLVNLYSHQYLPEI